MKPKIRSIHMYVRLALAGLAVLVAELIFPATTSAHVKWFASYDVTEPPLPFAEVATPVFSLSSPGSQVCSFWPF